jgi:hypothetical protein
MDAGKPKIVLFTRFAQCRVNVVAAATPTPTRLITGAHRAASTERRDTHLRL